MKLTRPLCILPVLAAIILTMPGCVVPTDTVDVGYGRRDVYVDRGPVTTSQFELVLGDGYAGRGYYYGPRNTRYFQRGHGITYYRTRELAPRQYWDRNYRGGSNQHRDHDRDGRDNDGRRDDRRDGDRRGGYPDGRPDGDRGNTWRR